MRLVLETLSTTPVRMSLILTSNIERSSDNLGSDQFGQNLPGNINIMEYPCPPFLCGSTGLDHHWCGAMRILPNIRNQPIQSCCANIQGHPCFIHTIATEHQLID